MREGYGQWQDCETVERHPGKVSGVWVFRDTRVPLAATRLDTLRVPPGNRLEALTHDRQGQHSIRVNDQWRVCFVWSDGDAYDVEIVDYH